MLFIPSDIFVQMVTHLQEAYPLEGCGFLSGEDNQITAFYPVKNQLQSRSEFRMDPAEQLAAMLDIEARGETIKAVFHSHPDHDAYLSEKDVASAVHWPDTIHIVVGLKQHYPFNEFNVQTKAFEVRNLQIYETALTIV